MTRPTPRSAPPSDGAPLAFVLRLRRAGDEAGSLVAVQIDDVQTSQAWSETSLEGAFDRIRLLVRQHLGHLPGTGDPSGKPH